IWNGFLLAPHLDAAFDRGFLTIRADGSIEVAQVVSAEDRARLGIDKPLRIAKLSDPHKPYLTWHWEKVFRGG
ncbi:MAG TPA: HNH endonuclease, partial [Pseudomonadota bacterium]|nr:HNH endonuclease [Pseudomonadota bacterium]